MLKNRYAQNTLWLFGGQSIRMGVGLVASAWVARYLGPGQYGAYNYVLSVVLLLQNLGNLGLTGVLRKRCIEEPESQQTVLGTAFFLNVFAGTIIYGILLLLVYSLPTSPVERGLFTAFGAILIADSFRCINIWFDAHTQSKYVVFSTTIPVILSAILKLIAIRLGADLLVFAVIFLLENTFIGLMLAGLYSKHVQSIRKWTVSKEMAKGLLKQSWPLILNGFAVNLYLRMDQVMLKSMQGEIAVGEYAAASRLSSLWYVIPMLLASSLTPPILHARKKSAQAYWKRMQSYMDFNTGIAYLIATPMCLMAPWIVRTIFGEAYASASIILQIHIWSCVFVFQGVARNVDIVGRGGFKISLISSMVGSAVNLSLNALLIPHLGGTGAAIATVCSQFFCTFALTAAVKEMRPVFRIQFLSLFLFFRLHSIYKELKSFNLKV
ncbi:MAG: flippase [Verrucomicrobia bacterium]|nr:flippase [Verrucomicrobiota bacterium]MCH8527346.1 flippase [Kiritimatiellia bacterium]